MPARASARSRFRFGVSVVAASFEPTPFRLHGQLSHRFAAASTPALLEQIASQGSPGRIGLSHKAHTPPCPPPRAGRSPRAESGAPGRTANRGLANVGAVVVAFLVVYPTMIVVDYLAKPRAPISEAALGLPHERVTFAATDGVHLAGWYVPSRNGAAIVLVHGGGGDRQGTVRHALAALGRELDDVRERGYAVEREEAVLGEVGVAAPIFGRLGSVVDGIGVAGPSERLTGKARQSALATAVGEAARAISRDLGAQRWPPAAAPGG